MYGCGYSRGVLNPSPGSDASPTALATYRAYQKQIELIGATGQPAERASRAEQGGGGSKERRKGVGVAH